MPTESTQDILDDIIGRVTDLSVSTVEDELRLMECAETVEALALNLSDAELAAAVLLSEIRKLRKRLNRKVAAKGE